uniref:Putative secreted protein n=1 Tax=Anopheles marajoara TaxID=58244 RepID=A0A2M4C9R9_9DIPT
MSSWWQGRKDRTLFLSLFSLLLSLYRSPAMQQHTATVCCSRPAALLRWHCNCCYCRRCSKDTHSRRSVGHRGASIAAVACCGASPREERMR